MRHVNYFKTVLENVVIMQLPSKFTRGFVKINQCQPAGLLFERHFIFKITFSLEADYKITTFHLKRIKL